MLFRSFLPALLVFLSSSLFAQSALKDSTINAFVIGVHYSYQFPQADMADRFGPSSKLGAQLFFKLGKNFIAGVDGGYIFGNRIREANLLSNLLTEDGNLIAIDGFYADYALFERGFQLQAMFGKIFSLNLPNPNSGILFLVGAGYLQHKIRVDVDEQLVPQLNSEYKKGYDRLTAGFQLSQFLGYSFYSNNGRINFFAGVEVIEGFTQNQRSWNYDTNSAGGEKRTDILIGPKVGWMLPIYFKPTEKYFYY